MDDRRAFERYDFLTALMKEIEVVALTKPLSAMDSPGDASRKMRERILELLDQKRAEILESMNATET